MRTRTTPNRDTFCAVSVSASLFSLINRITGSSHDPNSKTKLTENKHILSLSLSLLIHFNTVRQRRNSGTSRHTSARETPLSIYVAFSLHSQTRSHLLVHKFHDLGLPISYYQMLVSLTQFGDSV